MDYQRALDIIGPSEGNIPWIYKDTENRNTVGVGNLLAKVDDAVKLPFVLRGTTTLASGDEISADWKRVMASPGSRLASSYKALTKCDLPQDDVLRLFERRVDEFSAQLLHYFPDFESWPSGPQLATLDWVFNCGIGALMGTKFLKAALYAQNWESAAAACNRVKSSQKRNDQTRALFREGLA